MVTVAFNRQADENVPVFLQAAACLAVQRPDSTCRACADVCATAAITLSPRQVEVSAGACVACGRCSATCPTGALSAAVSADPAPAYECARVPADARAAGAKTVICLGGLTEETLRRALAAGDLRLMDRGWCSDCPVAGCAAPWGETIARLSAEADLLGLSARPMVTQAPLDPARALAPPKTPAAQGLSRRQLFSRMAAHAAPEPTGTQDALALLPGQIAPPRLAARLAALRVASGARPLDARLFPGVELPANADLRLAAGLCPTAALSLHELAEMDVLTFDAARCLGNGGCTACRTAGATVSPQGTGHYQGPVALIERSMTDCPKCDTRFAPVRGARICDNCRKDNDLAAFAHGLMRRASANRGA